MVLTPTDDTNPINQNDGTAQSDGPIVPLGSRSYKNAEVIDDDGSQAVGGDEQDLESDDNALDAAKSAGLYQNSAGDAQQDVNVVEQVQKAEKHRLHSGND